MAGPMPPGPPPGPPGGPPPPDQPPPGPPGGDEDPQGQSPAMKAVSMANDGLMQLATIFEKSNGEVSPAEQKQLAGIVQNFHQLIESLAGQNAGENAPEPKSPGGPMPAMAGKNSLPPDQG